MGWFQNNAPPLEQQAAAPPTNGWGGQAQKLLDQQPANPLPPSGFWGQQMQGYGGIGIPVSQIGAGGVTVPGMGQTGIGPYQPRTPPEGYHYGIDWDSNKLFPNDPNNTTPPPYPDKQFMFNQGQFGGQAPFTPGPGEGPGGFTGHAQDPNWGQLGTMPTGNGNLLGPNPIMGGNAMGGDTGMVQLRAPTGEVRAVPASQVQRFIGRGATKIG